MTVRRFEDLITWKLAHQLQDEVFRLTATGPAARDLGFCNQIRDSARSAPRNTAEGFGRFYPKEFLRFLRYASGSLHETKNHLHEGLDRGYLLREDHVRCLRLCLRAIKANNRLQRYLRNCDGPPPFPDN